MGRMQVMGNMETQDAQHSLWAPPVFPPLAHLDPRLPSPPPPYPWVGRVRAAAHSSEAQAGGAAGGEAAVSLSG